MKIEGRVVLVTGGGSGLGFASAAHFLALGARVVVLDRDASAGTRVGRELGPNARFCLGDVASEPEMVGALDEAERLGELRALVHCAGRGGPVRVVDREGRAGSQSDFEDIVRVNLLGSFNVLRLAAARIARLEPDGGERGVCILTASVAAWEGQIGQVGYAASKAGIVGLTLVAARDLASRGIRVCTIAPGVFDTPILSRLTPEQRDALARAVPSPARLGVPAEFAQLATQIVANAYLNGETIRLDGALRMGPR